MDKRLIGSKHFELYLTTLEVGLGLMYVPDHKSLHLTILLFEFVIYFGGK